MERVFFAIIAVLGILAFTCSGLASDEQTLRDVKFDSPAKQSVAAVILELESYYNHNEPDKLMSLFANDAEILTGMKGNRKGEWVSKKEYASIVETKLSRLAYFGVSIRYFKPSLCEEKNQAATVELPYMTDWSHHDVVERGIFKFDLENVAGKWLIKKMYWQADEGGGGFGTISDTDSVCF